VLSLSRQHICQLFVLRAYGNIVYGPTAYNFVLLIRGNLNPTGNIQWDTQSRHHAGVVRSAETALPITHLSGGVCTNTITLSLSRKQGLKRKNICLGWGEYPRECRYLPTHSLAELHFYDDFWAAEYPYFSISPMVSHKNHTYQAYFITKKLSCQLLFG